MIQYTKAFIQSLLDKYMEGTTTLEEEDILHQYFSRGDVPAEWEDYRMLFAEIDSMKLVAKPKRKMWRWGMAAAVVVVLVMFATTQIQLESRPELDLIAQVTESDSVTIPKAVEARPDSTPQPHHHQQAPSSTKRRLRKPQPTMTDYDKAYALMAEAAKEQQQAEQEMELAQQEILHAQLTAVGYVAIQQEDGTIIYTNEPKEYFAYEE
jgi:hypothetical protein